MYLHLTAEPYASVTGINLADYSHETPEIAPKFIVSLEWQRSMYVVLYHRQQYALLQERKT